MKDYNLVLRNPLLYDLTEIEKKYINIFLKTCEIKESEEREERENFRKICIEKYKKCVISDVFYKECDACHIIPYSIGLNDINNSLLLTKSLHELFDEGYWTIDSETGQILISEIIENENTSIHKYKNKNLKHILNTQLSKNLVWHYNNVFIK
jgi:predicted restriction endonuclease